jgi:Subunit CCDC53 of WASH complex
MGDTYHVETFKENHLIGKYFKMLQVGIPSEAVKIKMNLDGVDTKLLENDADAVIPSDLHATIHEKYTHHMSSKAHSKYIKMNKAKVSMDAIKQKMVTDGIEAEDIESTLLELKAINTK